MTWAVDLVRSADKEFQRLTPAVRHRIEVALVELTANARPSGTIQLTGIHAGEWRVRVGDWRIVYVIDEDARIVHVRRIRHRRDVYR